MMDLVRAKRDVFQAEKALADSILREHEVLSSLLRFQAETAGKRVDDADLGLGYMRVAFKRHGWTPHAQAPPSGQGCLHAGKLVMMVPQDELMSEHITDNLENARHVTTRLD
jgi:hypothetical protein